MGLLNKTMLGTDEIYGSVILDKDNPSVTKEGASAYSSGNEGGTRKEAIAGNFGNGLFSDGWKVPNMLYCPENIFSNKIPALDVNFIHPNSYKNVYGEETESYASKLAPTISSWYKAFRNISVVGLLCVLVYLGIRILIETSAQGKAKYKEALLNWFVALCLVFAIHFIMAGTLMLIDKVTELLNNSLGDSTIYVDVVDGNSRTSFKTNLTGYMRFMAESNNWGDATAYTIIYIVLVIYTIMFTFTYLKRFLWMAFLTMIAPLVSLTYPIDKAGDGKAQAFNMWFKEYIMNAILQPVHLLLYSVMVSSAMDLASDNPIYALVTIGFLIPAEKFIKKMFGLDKGQTAGGLGSFAGGAMTMKALESLGKKAPPPLGKGGPGKGNGQANGQDAEDNYKIRQNKRNTLESFNGEENNLGIDSSIDNATGNASALAAGGAVTDKITEDDSVDYSGVDKRLDDNLNKQNMDSIEQLGNSNFEQKESKKVSTKYNKKENNLKSGVSTGEALKRTVIKGAKRGLKESRYVGEKALRIGLKTAGTIMGGAIALGAGIVNEEDPVKAAQYLLVGAAAGNKIGEGTFNGATRIGNGVKNGVGNAVNTVKNDYREEKYGLAGARQEQIFKQNQKAKKAFMKDDEQKRKYKEMAATLEEKTGNTYTAQDLMNSAFDYKVAGLSDDQIEKGLELESKYGGVGGRNHEQMMDIVGLTGKYGQDYILDDKKRSAMEGIVASKVSNKKQQEQVMQLFAEAHGQGAYYKNISKKSRTQEKTKNDRKSSIVTGANAEEQFKKMIQGKN